MKLLDRLRRPAEKRQDSYTDALVSIIRSRTSAETYAAASATAGMEIAAGLWQRAFMAADVDGPDALTREKMGMIGRGLIRRGEVLFVIGHGQTLTPAERWSMHGDPDPQSWRYKVTTGGPGGTFTYDDLMPTQVVHLKYAVHPSRPWQGRGPLDEATLTGKFAAEMEAALGDEAAGTRGQLLPVPVDADRVIEDLQADIGGLAGRTAIVQAGDFGAQGEPRAVWEPKRLGAHPPDSMVFLMDRATRLVLSACGVPPALVDASDSQGSGAREAYRQFLHVTISPVARSIEEEISMKLHQDISMSFSELGAADIMGRARAYGSIMNANPENGGGISVEEARRLTGLH